MEQRRGAGEERKGVVEGSLAQTKTLVGHGELSDPAKRPRLEVQLPRLVRLPAGLLARRRSRENENLVQGAERVAHRGPAELAARELRLELDARRPPELEGSLLRDELLEF